MISVGSAIAFCILSGVAGIVAGALIGEHERRSEHRTDVGSEWGGINAAATKSYRGAHFDGLERYAAMHEHFGGGAKTWATARGLPLPLAAAELAAYAKAKTADPFDAAPDGGPKAGDPSIIVTCDLGPMAAPFVLDDAAFELLAGTTREEILRRLIPA